MEERWVAFEDAVREVKVVKARASWTARGGKGWVKKPWVLVKWRDLQCVRGKQPSRALEDKRNPPPTGE